MVSPASTTAPTRGFGATRPQPRRARSRARSIAARSAGGGAARSSVSLESEPDAETSEDMGRLGIEVRELRDEGLVLARLKPNRAPELHGRQGEARQPTHHAPRMGR